MQNLMKRIRCGAKAFLNHQCQRESDADEPETSSLSRKREFVALGLLILILTAINLRWLHQDESRQFRAECYWFMLTLTQFVDNLDIQTLLRPWTALGYLGVGGRPPLYLLLTVPSILIFGPSEDAAVYVNFLFLAILMISCYNIGRIAKSGKAGLLCALLAATYAPMIYYLRVYLPHTAVPACLALSVWQLLALLKSRSIKRAWVFGATLAFGLWIHPTFLWIATGPTVFFGVYMLLFQNRPSLPATMRQIPAWLLGKLRDPFAIRGLLPAALITIVLVLPWYLTHGLAIYKELEAIMSQPDLDSLRGAAGFNWVEPNFWWHARTTPYAITNVFTVFLLFGIASALIKWRLSSWVLVITLVAAYIRLSITPFQAWMYFIFVLPIFACVTAVWVTGIERRWLNHALTSLCVVLSGFVFSVSTWGVEPWSESVAVTLGSPLNKGTICENLSVGGFCPAPPEPDQWPLGEIADILVADQACDRSTPCQIMFVQRYGGIWLARMKYFLRRAGAEEKFLMVNTGTKSVGHPYNLRGLLESEYVLYPAITVPSSHNSDYLYASVDFLEAPTTAFDDTHDTLATFDFEGGAVKLVKRVAPLSSEEAEVSIAALELKERYKIQTVSMLSKLYVKEGKNIDQAASMFENVVKSSPKSFQARLDLADVYIKVGKTDKATAELEAASSLTPHNGAALKKLADLSRSLETMGSVVAAYENFLKARPDLVWARHALAEIHGEMGNSDAAIAEWEKAIDMKKDNAFARRGLADAYRSANRLDDAIVLYKEALDINPSDIWGHIKLAAAYDKNGSPEDGTAQLEAAIKATPSEALPRRVLADRYRSAAHRDLEKSISIYREALEVDPDDVWSHRGLATAYLEASRKELAAAELRAAAELYRSRNDNAQAAGLLRQALQADPGDDDAKSALAELDQ